MGRGDQGDVAMGWMYGEMDIFNVFESDRDSGLAQPNGCGLSGGAGWRHGAEGRKANC